MTTLITAAKETTSAYVKCKIQKKKQHKSVQVILRVNFIVHYCILEAASFEKRGISIHMQISGRAF